MRISDFVHSAEETNSDRTIQYESDASPGRFDAFLNGGNPAKLSVQNFANLYALQPGETGGNYDLGVLIDHSRRRIQESRADNPQRKLLLCTRPIKLVSNSRAILVSHYRFLGYVRNNISYCFGAISLTYFKQVLSLVLWYRRLHLRSFLRSCPTTVPR